MEDLVQLATIEEGMNPTTNRMWDDVECRDDIVVVVSSYCLLLSLMSSHVM